MASDSKEQVIIPRRKHRELISEELRYLFGVRMFSGDFDLSSFWEYFRREVTKPSFEKGADDIDVI